MHGLRNFAYATAFVASVASASVAQAADIIVDVTGINSFDAIGAPGNTRLVLNVTPGAVVDLVAWDVNLTAFAASYLSEIAVTFSNTAGSAVRLRPGVATAAAGTASFSGSGSLVGSGLSFVIGGDGKFYLEFHETFDDVAGAADGRWNSGTLTFREIGLAGGVPEPATWAMMLAGFGIVGGAMRRRQRTSVSFA
jgi:hypothetical protein